MGFFEIADEFINHHGRWIGDEEPWDSTIFYEAPVDLFLTTQEHVDIRNFRHYTDTIPRPQNPDLEVPERDQSDLDAMIQTDMEVKLGLTYSENWLMTGTGLTGMTYGKIASRDGWSGLTATTTGGAVNATLTSSMPDDPVDISGMDQVSLVFPNYNSFDTGTSTVTFTSSTDGTFGGSGDSAAVAFSGNNVSMPELRLDVSDFANSGFDNTNITGVRIVLKKSVAPSASLTVAVMAIRAVTNEWATSPLDFDTRLGWLVVPVTLNGSTYSGSIPRNFEYIRGDYSRLDPVPVDGSYTLIFSPGGDGATPHTGSDKNRLSVLFRELKDTDAGTGSVMEAALTFNASGTQFYVDVRNYNVSGSDLYGSGEYGDGTYGGSAASSGSVFTSAVENLGIVLDPSKIYAYTVTITGTYVAGKLTEILRDRTQEGVLWQSATISDLDIVPRNGRVGFVASFVTADAYVDALLEATTGFATLRTAPDVKRMPVDGISLQAIFSPDLNLFTNVTGADAFRDPTKTTSGEGSIRTALGIETNQFVAEDWNHLYLDLDLWVPSALSHLNAPRVVLNAADISTDIKMPMLQPLQWNHLHFDLKVFSHLLTGFPYSFSILAAEDPDTALGNFWVDSIKIGRRQVAWSARVNPGSPFRQFWGVANETNGSIHFNDRERGREVQIQADALTETAWVSSINAHIRFAPLGNMPWDENFET